MVTMARHSLAEKIRQLTNGPGLERRRNRRWETLQYIDVKSEIPHASYVVLVETQPETSTKYKQPVKITVRDLGRGSVYSDTYAIPRGSAEEAAESEPHASTHFPSVQKIRMRRKKKRSSTFSRIEELLTRGKNILLLPEPSEESLDVETILEVREIPKRTISDLSEDLLQRIFWCFTLKERCTVLSRVCKRWYYILKNPIFWTRLEFYHSKVPTATIISLVKGSPLLESLKLTGVPESSLILQELCSDKTSLKKIALRYCVMDRMESVKLLLEMLKTFPDLEYIDLKGTEFQSKRFFTELGMLNQLKSLNLGGNRFLHSRDLMTISVNCCFLEELKMLDIPPDVASKEKITDDNFIFIMSHLHPTLRVLKFDMQNLGNAAFMAILQCTKLESLYLMNCLFLSGDTFRRFKHLKGLSKLRMTRAINVASEDMEDLCASGMLADVKRLDFSGCWRMDEFGLEALTRAVPRVQSLNLENCKSIQGQDMKHLSRCKELKSLNIAHTRTKPGDLMVVAANAPQLRTLTIDRFTYDQRAVLELALLMPTLKMNITSTEHFFGGEYLSDVSDD